MKIISLNIDLFIEVSVPDDFDGDIKEELKVEIYHEKFNIFSVTSESLNLG